MQEMVAEIFINALCHRPERLCLFVGGGGLGGWSLKAGTDQSKVYFLHRWKGVFPNYIPQQYFPFRVFLQYDLVIYPPFESGPNCGLF